MKKRPPKSSVIPFQKDRKSIELRQNIEGHILLGKINDHINALEAIEQEMCDSVQDFERNVTDEATGEVTTYYYKSTTLDKETIAVFHTRISARKVAIDTTLKMINKVMPDLKAVEVIDDMANAAERAMKAFAEAAKS